MTHRPSHPPPDGPVYRLLGDLEVGLPGQPPVRLPTGAGLKVLAALLANTNQRMSKADLIRAGWGPDGVAEAQLYKRIREIRLLLEGIGRGTDLKTHPTSGYEIHVSAEEDVDSRWFLHLVRQAGVGGRADDEASFLRQALELWRGEHPLANLPGDLFQPERDALDQRRKRAAVRWFELELSRGHDELIMDELVVMNRLYPADQRLCEQLMLAEYHRGHLPDVTRVFERYRDALDEETGAPPDPLLQTLHFAVARGDEAAARNAVAAVAKRDKAAALPPPATVVPRQLPRPVNLVGREDLVAEISWLLSSSAPAEIPLVEVISGPGGIGKTALALRAAWNSREHYPDGQLFAELRGTQENAADTDEVLAVFLRALGVAQVPESKEERLATYRTLLADRRVLVVLDDAADGSMVSDLAPGSPGCVTLVTARRRLPEVPGAHHVAPLEPLTGADATELFRRVIQDAGIYLEDDPDAVGRVVQLCGGLPLALRIAAALYVHDYPLPVSDLVTQLASQGPGAFEYRELSLARTIGAGYERLDPGSQHLFLGLGLLPLPSFAAWTAAALLGPAPVTPARALSRLAASFMIQPEGSPPRYRFHDLTRDYARERAGLEYPGDRGAVPSRVYQALLTLVRRAHVGLHHGDFEVVHCDVPDEAALPAALAEIEADPKQWFERERTSIRAAVEHCAELGLTGLGWDLAVSSHEFYSMGDHFEDWYATHTVALAACRQAGDQRGEGILLACLNQPALLTSRQGGSGSLADLQRAVDLLAGCGDRHGQAIALRTLGNALIRQGQLTRPLALFAEALKYYEASEDTAGRAQALRFIGQAHLIARHYQEARRDLEAAEEVAVLLGDGTLIAQSRYWTGQGRLADGDLDGAQEAFDAVADSYRAGRGRAYAVHGLGSLALRRGEATLAENYLTEALAGARAAADVFLEGRVWLTLAELHRREQQPRQQVFALERVIQVFADGAAEYLEIRAWAELAQVLDELAGPAADRPTDPAADAAWRQVEARYRTAGVPEADRMYHRPAR